MKARIDYYKEGLMLTLSGYQLIEAFLKNYLENYFTIVKHAVPAGLHFGFDGKDYENAALGTLVKVFTKVCGNQELVSELKSVISHRDHIAHRAMLVLYQTEPLSEEGLEDLISEVRVNGDKSANLIKRLREEHNKLIKVLG